MAGCKSDDAYYAMAKYLAKFSLTLAMAPMILGKDWKTQDINTCWLLLPAFNKIP